MADRSASPLVLLFDLDGTLTDPRPGVVRCMRHALDAMRAPCPRDDVLASFIGPLLRRTFATLLGTSDGALIERAMSLYREEYGETGLFENQVYGGVSQMLEDVWRVRDTAGPRPRPPSCRHVCPDCAPNFFALARLWITLSVARNVSLYWRTEH